MKRTIDKTLLEWKADPYHKILLVRGARQVGKTFSIRNLGKTFKYLVEVNFEEKKELKTFFDADLSPANILEKLSAFYGIPIIPGETLLFFDEIQSCPLCLSSLRFFYEQEPKLHVIAAGSLLEFAIAQIPSFGVGRISSLFMYPLNFFEFLQAIGMEQLMEMIKKSSITKNMDTVLHKKAVSYLRTYFALGGMPEVIATYCRTKDLRKSQQVIDELLNSFKDDFSKYKKGCSVELLCEAFESIARQTGGKFMYTAVDPHAAHSKLKSAVHLLVQAGLAHVVYHSNAQGLPLGAQINTRRFKILIFDIGIYQRLMHLDLSAFLLQSDTELINKGAIAELFAGLEFIANESAHIKFRSFYWHRESRNSNAEVDYLLQYNGQVIPIEVKAGTKGSMQSLHLFLAEHSTPKGIRLSHENYSEYDKIQSIPLYAAGTLVYE